MNTLKLAAALQECETALAIIAHSSRARLELRLQAINTIVQTVQLDLPEPEPLTPEERLRMIQAARDLYGTDDVNIDDDALVSDCEDGSYWVQAWVFVHSDEVTP